jgi:predicted Abi (CAAX) family protease
MYYDGNVASVTKWNKTSATILYARWQEKDYTVTLNRNGGKGGSTSFDVKYGGTLPSNLTAPTREEYVFEGYYYAQTRYFDRYMVADSRSWTDPSITELKALWIKVVHSVTVYEKGEDATVDDDGVDTTDEIYGGNSISDLMLAGYSSLTFVIHVDIKEIYDGYQAVYLYINGIEASKKTDIDSYNLIWDHETITVTIDLSTFVSKYGTSFNFKLGFGASGVVGDDWTRGMTTVVITAN